MQVSKADDSGFPRIVQHELTILSRFSLAEPLGKVGQQITPQFPHIARAECHEDIAGLQDLEQAF